MKVKITVSYEIDNLIDEETLNEVYQNDLTKCVLEAIESESLIGIVNDETLQILKVERLDNLQKTWEIKYKSQTSDSLYTFHIKSAPNELAARVVAGYNMPQGAIIVDCICCS